MKMDGTISAHRCRQKSNSGVLYVRALQLETSQSLDDLSLGVDFREIHSFHLALKINPALHHECKQKWNGGTQATGLSRSTLPMFALAGSAAPFVDLD